MKVFAEKGFENASIQQIALVAGVANGTFYNYFPTKEAILEASVIDIGVAYCERISASYAHIADGAERMAIGNRRYLLLAVEQSELARYMLTVATSSPLWAEQIGPYVRADLNLGIKQGRFHVASPVAAIDLVNGTITAGIHSILEGRGGRGHVSAVTATVLRGLGMPPKEADEVARRPLPPMPPATED